jgi:aqualysin 1
MGGPLAGLVQSRDLGFHQRPIAFQQRDNAMIARSNRSFLRLALCATAALWTITASAQQGDPGSARPFARSERIADEYIVVFKDHVTNPRAEAANAVASAGGQVHFTYTAAIKGFSATLPAPALAALRNNPNVDYIEQDQTVSLSADEGSATWGIDRVDQHDLPLNQTYHYDNTGAGVNAFIIDTGILSTHVEFGGRVLTAQGFTSVLDGNGTNDCNGHGTHVSGTVGGAVYGIAKDVKLIPVRVLNCRGSGSWSGVIAGIDFAANSNLRPAVANMSLGGGFSSSVNAAVAGAVRSGVTMAVAAGNDGANACNYSPASEPSAITVGATTTSDARASYSNFGTCVDIFAPGSGITSAWKTSNTAVNTISGTSMATPHVTGTAALLAQANAGASPATIASMLTGNATTNKVTSAGTGSPNRLLYTLGTGAATPPAAQEVAVQSISTSAALTGNPRRPKSWEAQATVTVYDTGSSAVVANATVSGTFAPGASASCLTGSNGSCTLSSGNLSLSVNSTTFSVTNVSGTSMTYDSGANAITAAPPISRP